MAHGLIDPESRNREKTFSEPLSVAKFFGRLGVFVVIGGVSAKPAMPGVPSGEFLELVAGRLRALSDPWRVRLLLGLQGREASVQDLADELGMPHKGASSHLNVLYRDGLLTRRREGKLVLYSLADYTAPQIIAQVCAGITARVEELGEIARVER
jgi:DNA-binding transcriptional ArsR family regulator